MFINNFGNIFTVYAEKIKDVNSIYDAMELFGITEDNLGDENLIKSKYKQLAKQFHPDINPDIDSTENFKTVQKALEIIEKSYFPQKNVSQERTFKWKNDPLVDLLKENINTEDLYQTDRNVEDNDEIKKIRDEIQRVKTGEGGEWKEFKGSQLVFAVDLKTGRIKNLNLANSRSKNAYREFVNDELGYNFLRAFELVNGKYKSLYHDYVQSGMDKKEADKKARLDISQMPETKYFNVSPEKLDVYRKKRISQLNYIIKKLQTNISVDNRTQDLYESNQSPSNIIELLSEEYSPDKGVQLFTHLKNSGIFKVPSKGRRKGLITIDPHSIEGLTNNNNPISVFMGSIGLVMRKYLDSTIPIPSSMVDYTVRSNAEKISKKLAGIEQFAKDNQIAYPEDKIRMDSFTSYIEAYTEMEDRYFESRFHLPAELKPKFAENAFRGIYMHCDSDDPNASQYKYTKYSSFTKQFVNDNPVNEEYARLYNVATSNTDKVSKNIFYYATQIAKALILSKKSDVNRGAVAAIRWDEDDRPMSEKFQDAFSSMFG